MPDTKVVTAPLATIKVNGIVVGKMRNITLDETYRRGRVSGLGTILPLERPALEWNGTLTCDFFLINLRGFDAQGNYHSKLPFSSLREVPSILDWMCYILLQENGVDVDIYKKISKGIDPQTGLVIPDFDNKLGTVRGCFVDREGFNINEGQIAGSNQVFVYNTPLLFFK